MNQALARRWRRRGSNYDLRKHKHPRPTIHFKFSGTMVRIHGLDVHIFGWWRLEGIWERMIRFNLKSIKWWTWREKLIGYCDCNKRSTIDVAIINHYAEKRIMACIPSYLINCIALLLISFHILLNLSSHCFYSICKLY